MSNALIILGFLYFGQPETEPIAKVGDEIINIGEFNKLYQPTGVTNIDSLKKATLDKLIANKLMLIDAKNKGFDSLIEISIRDFKNRLTIGALYEEVVTKRVKVAPWTLRTAWWQMNPTLKVSQMIIKDRDTAIKVYKELRKGADFITLATKYSEDYSAKYGGTIPDIRRGSGDREIEAIAFSLRHAGAFSRPIPSPLTPWYRKIFQKPSPVQNYRIIKLNEIINKPLPDFSQEKDKIEQKVKGEQTRKLSDGYLNYLKRMAKIRYNTSAIKKVLKGNVPEKEKQITLASWVGGKLTIEEFLKKTEMEMARGRRFDTPESIKQWMEGALLFETLLPAAAARYKFDQKPDIQSQLKDRRETLLIQQYKEKEINAKSGPTDEETKAYYNKNKAKYDKKLKFDQVKARVSWDLEQEKRTAREGEIIKELRSKIPVEIIKANI